ncbi:MAG: FtsK/SpoIIIE domain-containing protein [Clostridia bacterium]|nr:FtsK/SpoIIIE domain-containing protein [Clostridia bacterium]
MSVDKQIEKEVEHIIHNILAGVGKLLASIFYGLKTLRKWGFLWLLIWTVAGWALIRFRTHIWAPDKVGIKPLVYAGFAFPFFYLFYSGEKYKIKRNEMKEKFLEIGFFSGLKTMTDSFTGEKYQEKNTPLLIKKEVEGKKVLYTFKSNIPLQAWQKRGHELEALFNFHIVKLQPALKSKQVITLHTIPAEEGLGDYVPWSNQFIRIPEAKPKGKKVVQDNKFELVCGLSMLDEVVFDLSRNPHILIAGLTGSGKSVLETCLTWQCIRKGAVVYMVDFKAGIELGHFKAFGEVVKDRKRVIEILEKLVKENDLRLNMLESVGCRDMEEFNKKFPEKKLCRVVLVCDEVAEMLDATGADKPTKNEIQEILKHLATLARLGRAPGINLIMATQRPDANVLPGQVKGMLQVRISGLMKDKQNSEMIVGDSSAVELPDVKGRFVYSTGGVETHQFQAYHFTPEYIQPGSYKVGRMLMEGDKEEIPDLTVENIQAEPKKENKKTWFQLIPKGSIKPAKEKVNIELQPGASHQDPQKAPAEDKQPLPVAAEPDPAEPENNTSKELELELDDF